MKNSRNSQLSDRRTASAEAKAALLNAYKAARASDEPARAARQAERASITAAREERRIERARVKLEEQARADNILLLPGRQHIARLYCVYYDNTIN